MGQKSPRHFKLSINKNILSWILILLFLTYYVSYNTTTYSGALDYWFDSLSCVGAENTRIEECSHSKWGTVNNPP